MFQICAPAPTVSTSLGRACSVAGTAARDGFPELSPGALCQIGSRYDFSVGIGNPEGIHGVAPVQSRFVERIASHRCGGKMIQTI